MALGRSRREPTGHQAHQLGGSRAGLGNAEQLDPRVGMQPAAKIGPSQMLDRARSSRANGHGPESDALELGHQRGDIENPVYRVPRASVGKLEGEMRRGWKASTNVPEPDAGRRERPECRPGISIGRHPPSSCFLNPSPGPGLGPIQALKSASANALPSIVPFAPPFTCTRVPSPGK